MSVIDIFRKLIIDRIIFYISALRNSQSRIIIVAGMAIIVISSFFAADGIAKNISMPLSYGLIPAISQDSNINLMLYEIPTPKINTIKMRATAYDLSFESCGKKRSDPAYGITSSGTRASVGNTIAVDTQVIPLGSRVYISFPEKYKYMNGIYNAEDTGRLIKGYAIDVFFGEDEVGSTEVNKSAMEFGVQYVEVEIID